MSCWASLYCRGVSVATVARLYITHTSNFSFCGDWERLSFIYFFPFLNIFSFYDFVIRLMFISPFFLSFFFLSVALKFPYVVIGNVILFFFFPDFIFFHDFLAWLMLVSFFLSFLPAFFFQLFLFFFYFPYVATEIALLFFYLFSKRFSLWLFWYEWCPYLWIISPFFKIFLMFQLGKLLLLFSLPNFSTTLWCDWCLPSFFFPYFSFFFCFTYVATKKPLLFYFTFFSFLSLSFSTIFFYFVDDCFPFSFLPFLSHFPILLSTTFLLFFLFLSMVSLIFQTVFKVFLFTSLIFLFFFPFFSFPFLLFSSPIPTLHFPLIWYSTKALFFYIYFKSHLHYVSNCSVFSSPYRILYWQRTIACFPRYGKLQHYSSPASLKCHAVLLFLINSYFYFFTLFISWGWGERNPERRTRGNNYIIILLLLT